MRSIHPIKESLERVHLGDMHSYNGLTMWPIFGPDITGLDYKLLNDACDQDELQISENEIATVSEIHVKNLGELPVFGLDGEQLVGAKQNRVLNLSVLFPEKTDILVPVSCVERGRWSGRDSFRVHSKMHHASGRAKRVRNVSHAMRSRGEATSDQHEVWDEIVTKQSRMHAPSPSEDMTSFYVRNKPSLSRYDHVFQARPNQIGMIVEIEKLIGIELFDRASTLRRLFTKILHGYAIDALENTHHSPHTAGAKDLLGRLWSESWSNRPSVGLGHDYRSTKSSYVASALIAHELCVHLCGWQETPYQ